MFTTCPLRSICKFLMKVTPGSEWGTYQVQIYFSIFNGIFLQCIICSDFSGHPVFAFMWRVAGLTFLLAGLWVWVFPWPNIQWWWRRQWIWRRTWWWTSWRRRLRIWGRSPWWRRRSPTDGWRARRRWWWWLLCPVGGLLSQPGHDQRGGVDWAAATARWQLKPRYPFLAWTLFTFTSLLWRSQYQLSFTFSTTWNWPTSSTDTRSCGSSTRFFHALKNCYMLHFLNIWSFSLHSWQNYAGGGADYSAQWAEYYRSIGKVPEVVLCAVHWVCCVLCIVCDVCCAESELCELRWTLCCCVCVVTINALRSL